MSDSTDLPVPRPAHPVSPSEPPSAFPSPSAFTIGAAPVPAPPAFAAPDPAYTATPSPYPLATTTSPASATPTYPAPAYPTPAYPTSAYPAAGYPVTAQPAYGGYGGYGASPGGYYPAYVPQVKTNGMAIGSMVTAIVGATLLFCYGAGLPLGLVGAILGHVARRQIRERGDSGDGMALAGVIVGWIAFAIAVIATVLIIIFVVWAANQPPSTFDSTTGY